MGSAAVVVTRDCELTYFADSPGAATGTRVTAVVVRRTRDAAPEPHHRGLLQAVRTMLRPPAPRPAAPWTLPDGWDAATGGGGPREVLHSRARGVVRVAGQEHRCASDGSTLVVLVDEGPPDGAHEPVVTTRTIVVPSLAELAGPRGSSGREYVRLASRHQAQVRRLVLEAVRADPVIRAFIARTAHEHAAGGRRRAGGTA